VQAHGQYMFAHLVAFGVIRAIAAKPCGWKARHGVWFEASFHSPGQSPPGP
jgi:hypothetical protein